VAACALLACAGSGADSVDLTKPVTGEAASNAEKAFKKGEEERRATNYLDATRYYEYVKQNFPYSQYAPLSELSLCDMLYDRDEYDSAAKAYEEFVKSHPSHPKADYASFRVGLSRYQDKPSDVFILPPSYEREQTSLKNAVDAFNRFLAGYPTSPLVPQARIHLADARKRLVRHEQYVAGFYWKRNAFAGSAGRWTGIAQTYGDLDSGKMRGEALWRASEAWRAAKDQTAEVQVLQRLMAQATPDDEHRGQAQKRLEEIEKSKVPPAALGLPPAAPPPSPPAAKPPEAKPPEAKAPDAAGK
jgi:outer membrane protein assembly factor BamD